MNDWDFLLQKQGDCAWLPLEFPSAEILEGHYQVIARSADLPAGTPVTVQITHLYEVEGVAQRHWQQRSLCLGPDGEILLLPTAYLGAGLWTLACAATAAPGLDLLANSAAQVVQLQVLAQDLDLAWEPERIPVSALPEPLEAPPSPSAPPLLPEAVPALDLPTFTYPTTAWCLKVVQGPTLPPKLFDLADSAADPPSLPPLPRRQPSQASPPPTPSPAMKAAFESLRLQERFWENLQTLSHQIISGENSPPEWSQAEEPQPMTRPAEVALPALTLRQQTATLTEIPLPTLVVQDTVEQGQPLTIYIRLPQSLQRLGVKLWVCDRQTRALIDGPHWLTDFVPNPRLGMQEALTQITLPLTTEAVSFTAIAIDLQTQRESHRTVVQRLIRAESMGNRIMEI